MKRMTHTFALFVTAALVTGLIAGCSTYRSTGGDIDNPKHALENASEGTLEQFKKTDPSLATFFENAHGYAVIPEVAKGAAGIGAARGHGVVYQDDEIIGYVTMTQGTLGVQLGGQVYSQLMFFENEATLERFKRGNLELSARASAVAASAGTAADADYESGVAIFTLTRTGLMFEAAVGGQKFTFEPKGESEQ